MITIFINIVVVVRKILCNVPRANWELHAPSMEWPRAANLQAPLSTLRFSSPNIIKVKSSRNCLALWSWKIHCCLMSSCIHLLPFASLYFSVILLSPDWKINVLYPWACHFLLQGPESWCWWWAVTSLWLISLPVPVPVTWLLLQ